MMTSSQNTTRITPNSAPPPAGPINVTAAVVPNSTMREFDSRLMQGPRRRPQSERFHCGESIEREDGIAHVSE